MFNSTIREVYNTNVALKYLPLEAISKEFDEEKVSSNLFDKF